MKKTALITALMAAAILVGCNGSSDDSDDDLATTTTPPATSTGDSLADILATYPKAGSYLPYTSRNLLDPTSKQTIEQRYGGFGSAMAADPTSPTRFYSLTDRGPNAECPGCTVSGVVKTGKKFLDPSYTPCIGLFQLGKNGQVTLVKKIQLKRPDGVTLLTGLPNPSGLGGTGEIPYNLDGKPIGMNSSLDYDPLTNPLKLDDYGLDSEGLVALQDGTFWVSDEYGPHIVHFDADGKEIGRINPLATSTAKATATGAVIKLPAELSKRWVNRGMEGLTVTPDQKTLVGIIQSSLDNPNAAAHNIDMTRIVTVNLETGKIGQYLYKQDVKQNMNNELATLSATQFLVIERDGVFPYGGPTGPSSSSANPSAIKRVYRFDLNTGTNLENVTLAGALAKDAKLGLTIGGQTLEQVILNSGWDALKTAGIVPVEKTLVVDMIKTVSYPHDKMEGLWIVDGKHLGVINDDDFAVADDKGVLIPKLLDVADPRSVDGNHLYIIDADLSVK